MNRTAVEQIKERLPINEVIGNYLKLEKSGASYKAKCPFHNEKSASFFVSPDRGGYYCFGCGAKGDIFSFIEQFEGLDFRGALKILAEKAGVQLSFDKKADGERDKLFQIIEEATVYFEEQYKLSKQAQQYIKSRGINDNIRQEFRIGWALEGWSNLYMYLKKKGWSDNIIEKAGLAKKSDKGEYYDRFRGRVMFPMSDSGGRVVAFSGRILIDDEKSAKYLNSPDSLLFDKSLILYGLDKAKNDIRKNGYTIMVEGQMDLVMSHQAGVKNTVASSGTALTDETIGETGAISNLGLVRRLSTNIIIAFDSDSAGRKAALRAAGIALSIGMDVKIADLVDGKDPADLVLQNPEKWKQVLRDAKQIIEFELGNIIKDTPDQRKISKALRERVFPFLARIESRMDKAHYVKMISDRTNIIEAAIWDDLQMTEKTIKDQENKNPTNAPINVNNTKIVNSSKIDLIERRMFGLISLIEKAQLSSVENYREEIKKISGDSYEERIKRIQPIINDISFEAEAFFGSDQKEWDYHMNELVANFEENIINEDLINTMNLLRIAEKNGEVEKVAEIAKKCQILSVKKGELAKKRKF